MTSKVDVQQVLKSCPFCGSNNILAMGPSEPVYCRICRAQAANHAAWNTRIEAQTISPATAEEREFEITPAMIEAGVRALREWVPAEEERYSGHDHLAVRDAFLMMLAASEGCLSVPRQDLGATGETYLARTALEGNSDA